MPDHVTVVGAGIGGLVLAIALSRLGLAATVLERAPRIAEIGAGVQVSPNGFAVLQGLGLADALRAVSVRSTGVALIDGPGGHRIVEMPLRGADYHMVHRAALIAILADAARDTGVDIRLNSKVSAVKDDEEAILWVNGKEERATFAVGADGLHSVVRPVLDGADTAFFTGQVAWRAIVHADAPPKAQVFVGPGRHLVAYPLGQNRLNIVAVEERAAWTDEGWHLPGDVESLRKGFAGFAEPVPNWLARVEACHLWGLHRHPVAASWHGRALAILGDAAHPTLPFLAQGANLAMEDAWCLARALASEDRNAALARYQSIRIPRVTRAIDAANANARNYHLRGVKRHAAHAALRLARLAPGMLTRRFDWLYGHDVTAGESGP